MIDPYKQLVDAFLDFAQQKGGTPRHDELFWVFEEMEELVKHRPEDAWIVIRQIADRNPPPSVLGYLAAGPLEDLLSQHGPAFIERAEAAAARDSQFVALLDGMYQNTMSDEVWRRVQAAIAREAHRIRDLADEGLA
jgi:hypothetical protein